MLNKFLYTCLPFFFSTVSFVVVAAASLSAFVCCGGNNLQLTSLAAVSYVCRFMDSVCASHSHYFMLALALSCLRCMWVSVCKCVCVCIALSRLVGRISVVTSWLYDFLLFYTPAEEVACASSANADPITLQKSPASMTVHDRYIFIYYIYIYIHNHIYLYILYSHNAAVCHPSRTLGINETLRTTRW